MHRQRGPRAQRRGSSFATSRSPAGPASLGGGPAPTLLELQNVAGNTAVTRLLRETGAIGIGRAVDTESPSAALDDPSFNAESITHDLLRAIDQKEYMPVLDEHLQEDASKERRKVDFDKVVAVLSDKTPSQIAEIEKRYKEFESRDLTVDLFEGGESNRQSNLTPDQRARIAALLKGTRGEPIPPHVTAELKTYPPEVAAKLGAAMIAKSNAAAAVQQLEADAIEVHELLFNTLDEPQRERLMALYRRPVKDVEALDAVFAQRFGPMTLEFAIIARLSPLQRSRLQALQQGDHARADACAIEAKRQSIEAIAQDEQADAALDDTMAGELIRTQREKKKAELSGEVESILDMNRREALADTTNRGKSSSQAVADRLNSILGQRVGDSAATLGSNLATSLPREHAGIVAAATDTWNTSGASALVQSAAAELVSMEKEHATTAARIIETLRSFRKLAEHDLRAHVLDPSVPQQDKEKIAADIESAVTRLGQQYIEEYRAEYDRLRGDGRTYDAIIESADRADETLIGDLTMGGGRTSDLGELQHAMGNKDIDKVKQILRRQPGQQAIHALIDGYNHLDDGHDFRKELFGSLPDGQQVTAEMAQSDDIRWITHGLLKGRDAAQVEEQLEKPDALAPTLNAAGGPAQAPGMAGQSEVNWITKGGTQEFSATMSNRGWTGKMREWGGDPETERLLKSSNAHLQMLAFQYAGATSPEARQHVLLEIRKTRAALTGDAEAYEKDNERVLGEIRGALSFAVSIALAVAIPGAGAGVMAFIETTALNVAANVAANMVIKGSDYSLADLKGDVFGGVLGAAGGKFGDELLGRVAAKITASTGKAAAGVGEKVGIETALARELSSVASSGEKIAIGADEFEAREVAQETAAAVSGGGSEEAAQQAARKKLFEKGSREVGAFFGGIYGAKVYSGDFGLSVEEVLQALATAAAGKAAHREPVVESLGPGEGAHSTRSEDKARDRETPAEVPSEEKTRAQETHDEEAQHLDSGPAVALPLGGDALGRRTTSEMLSENGLPADNASAFQAFADQYNLIVKVRPTNTASLPILEKGGLPKAEIVKAKTLNRTDMLIGGPAGHEGKVGFFEPKMPSQEILDVLSPEALNQVKDRYTQRLEEYNHYKAEYAQLSAEGLVRIDNGVLQIADPRQAATPDAPHGPFKDVGGDHDVYDIRHADDGSPLTDAERTLATNLLRSMGISVEHGFHVAWAQDSPGTYSAAADARIRAQHGPGGEPLVAFVPKSSPREVYADTELRGPKRTPGPKDPFQPLKGARVVEPGPHDSAGEANASDETDFSKVGQPDEARQPRASHPKGPHSPDRTLVKDVLQTLNAPGASVTDRLTYAIIDRGWVQVFQLEELPQWTGAEMMAQHIDPVRYVVVDIPGHGPVKLEREASGQEVGRGIVVVSHNMTPDQVRQTLRHEVNHVLRDEVTPGSIEDYQGEFDAAWMDGSFDHFKPAQRAIEIRKHILEQYEAIAKAYTDDPAFAQQVKEYTRPKGNTLNSVVWRNAEVDLTSSDPKREEMVLKDLGAAPPQERALLLANENFIKMLEQHGSPEFVAEARKVLAREE